MLTIYVVFVICFLKNDQFLWVTDVHSQQLKVAECTTQKSKLQHGQNMDQNCRKLLSILTITNCVSYNTIVLHALYEVIVTFVVRFWLRW